MPEFLHPPFAATATQTPKQLNRWLDINAQNGPLERNQAYFVLPAFNQAVTWQGYSEIAVAYNYEGPNNFSLKYLYQGSPTKGVLSPIPSLPNYSLAIMWIDKAGVVQRRFLWIATGAVFYFATQLYANEKVLKNFRLEVWTTNVANVTQAAPLSLFTSVRGTLDYRYGTDFSLVKADAACTNFAVPNIDTTAIYFKPVGAAFPQYGGLYKVVGVVNGRPSYQGRNPDYTVQWDNINGGWSIQYQMGINAYIAQQDVATPDLVDASAWAGGVKVGYVFGNPIFQTFKTKTFSLPLTFPANAVPQPN